MKTLFLSDLDGILMRSDEQISEYTSNVKCQMSLMVLYAQAPVFIRYGTFPCYCCKSDCWVECCAGTKSDCHWCYWF